MIFKVDILIYCNTEKKETINENVYGKLLNCHHGTEKKKLKEFLLFGESNNFLANLLLKSHSGTPMKDNNIVSVRVCVMFALFTEKKTEQS